MIDNGSNIEQASEAVKEILSEDGASLETQIQKCVDVIMVYQKQKNELIVFAVNLQKMHNRTLQQIEFFPN